MSSFSPLDCGHDHGHTARVAAQDDDEDDDRERAATSNVTDLRRSRQRARAVFREIQELILEFLQDQNVQAINDSEPVERRINEQITRLSSETLQRQLLPWLEDRRKTVWGRAVRAALDDLQRSLSDEDDIVMDRRDLFGHRPFTGEDRALNRVISQIDAGLLYDNNDSLANEIGDRITRQLRLGVSQNEPLMDHRPTEDGLGARVDMVLNDGQRPDRQEHGVTGHTVRTKGELIAHDSIQDAYNTAATKRYLNNGFRFVIYDAVLDTRTTDLCERLDGHVIDLTETPWLIAPNHPWCRSGARPTLNREGRKPLSEDRIADSFLQDIFQTASFRPTAMNPDDEFRPTAVTRMVEEGRV